MQNRKVRFYINHYCYHNCYCTFIGCRQKEVSYDLDEKSSLKSAKKEENHIFVYKRKCYFLLYKKFHQNLKRYYAVKLNKTYLVNIWFYMTFKDSFLEPKISFCLKVHTLEDSFTCLWEEILCHIFLRFYAIF